MIAIVFYLLGLFSGLVIALWAWKPTKFEENLQRNVKLSRAMRGA